MLCFLHVLFPLIYRIVLIINIKTLSNKVPFELADVKKHIKIKKTNTLECNQLLMNVNKLAAILVIIIIKY